MNISIFNAKYLKKTNPRIFATIRKAKDVDELRSLLPGLARTDEAVFNVPRQGKNYLRARELRNLLSILPNGARVYEFHSWEKRGGQETAAHIDTDVPILDYLTRLKESGESVSDYESIWYYF